MHGGGTPGTPKPRPCYGKEKWVKQYHAGSIPAGRHEEQPPQDLRQQSRRLRQEAQMLCDAVRVDATLCQALRAHSRAVQDQANQVYVRAVAADEQANAVARRAASEAD